MNEKQPYEKHLADKLQQLPPPEHMNRQWEQMRKLLDKEMPRGGAYGGSGGRGKRYWLLLLLGIGILTATWFTGREFLTGKPSGRESTVQSGKSTPASGEALPGNTPETTHEGRSPSAGGTTPSSADEAGNPSGTATGPNQPVNSGDGSTASPVLEPPPVPPTAGTSQPSFEKPFHQQKQQSHEAIITQQNDDHVSNANRSSQNKNRFGNTTGWATESRENHKKNNENNTGADKGEDQHITLKNNRNNLAGNNFLSTKGTSSAFESELSASPVMAEDLMPSFTNPSEGRTLASKALTLKVNKTPETPEYIAARARAKRIARNRAEKAFAVGLSLPLGFPLGDQQALGYNRNAGANTVSDYLPSPHVQYYFNNKTFVQGEIQAISPQFIRPILMYDTKQFENGSNAWYYNTVSARKLYYFNLPLTIHHSPMKNFYLGTGLQFSSLLSSVAFYEEKKVVGGQQVYAKESYGRLSGDSLSGRLNNNEVRLLLDLNYYWQRFTVGLRYNQALNNYASFQVSNNTPFVYDKNKALQFYLRYNLWEDKKRKQPTKSMLTLK